MFRENTEAIQGRAFICFKIVCAVELAFSSVPFSAPTRIKIVFNPNRLIPKLFCSEIGLDTTGKSKQRTAQFGKPNRRSDNKIVTDFKTRANIVKV